MIIGGGVFALGILASSNDFGSRTWTEVCKASTAWGVVSNNPTDYSNIANSQTLWVETEVDIATLRRCT